MRKCLVTGGAGFIGSHLVDNLLSAGWKVAVLDDLNTGKAANLQTAATRIEQFHASLLDAAAVERAVAGCEVVFHIAALPSVARSVVDPLRSHEVCATGTLKVLDAARRAGVRRVVYAASSSAYGGTPGTIRREDDAIAPLSPYAAAKLAGEHYCQAFTASYGLETARLRYFNIFGPRQDADNPYAGVIALFCKLMLEGRTPTIQGDGLQSRDFTYVANAVQATIKAANAPAAVGQVYNIGNGANTTVLDLVKSLNKLLGVNIEPTFGPPRAGDVRHSQADISRARRDLGYEPSVTFLEGLRRTLDDTRSRLT
ncbi:MAG: SDR family oxidoreductase [Planctomycetes bacterium]|nr:SDR family oxidoreductase [Planctomycetota bacterium]